VAQAPSSLSLPDTAEPFLIGNSPAGIHGFIGSVDEVAVYGTALAPQRVLAHFTAGKRP
jgi:hypothetical protein